MARRYRFYYHYNKRDGKVSIHFRGRCYSGQRLICCVPCQSRFNQRQPRFVMAGFATDLLEGPRGEFRIQNLKESGNGR
jgi:hypothetical protein